MKIETILLSDYKDAPYNPRLDLKPGDSDYEKLKRSIDEFGFLEPLVVNKRTHHIISGHQRVKILKEKGVTKIEAVVVDFSIEKEKAANLAMNRVRGNWNKERLAALLDELSELPDFDVTISGFDMPEISQILDRYGEQKDADDFDFNATLETIKEPITKKGDIVELGAHRILCGDSTLFDDVKLLMGEDKAQMVNMDPPYNIAYLGGNRPNPKSARPKRSRNWDRIYSDNLSQEEYEEFLKKAFANMDKVLMPGCSFYIWNGHYQFAPMHRFLTELKYHIGCVITWAKPNFAISYGDYHQQTEFALYGWKESEKHRWFGPVNESSLWQVKRDPTSSYIHPTQKPIELAQRAIRNSSERGEIVLDMFLGSGSTLIAAETLERRCFGLELDCRYIDGIVRRYIAFVGENKVPNALREKYLKEISHAG